MNATDTKGPGSDEHAELKAQLREESMAYPLGPAPLARKAIESLQAANAALEEREDSWRGDFNDFLEKIGELSKELTAEREARAKLEAGLLKIARLPETSGYPRVEWVCAAARNTLRAAGIDLASHGLGEKK